MKARYGSDEKVKAVANFTSKAAQPIADTATAGWAAELVQDSYAGFMDLLKPESVVARLALERYDFGKSNSIKIPMRDTITYN